MIWRPFQSVRSRLWSALALLSLAVFCISAVTWLSLERVDQRLQDLHQQTLSQVAEALELSKRSTDLATSAPYLLNQRSNFLINQEGQKLLDALADISIEWPTRAFGNDSADNMVVSDAIDRVSAGVTDLIAASFALDGLQTDLRGLTSQLGVMRDQADVAINSSRIDNSARLIWWKLQGMTSDALNASNAGNLIGVGEERRHFLDQRRTLVLPSLTETQRSFLLELDTIVGGSTGVFELRRLELSTVLDAQNALFRIRHDAGVISSSASNFAISAEQFLAAERNSSSSAIQFTKIVVIIIALASLGIALISAIYVSRYVTFNMARISSAMVQLAGGDRSSDLPREFPNADEIGDLFRSFRMFRANALRLDRSNRQLDRQNTLLQKVFANISDGIVIADASGRINAQNPAMEAILDLGAHQLASQTFIEALRSGQFGAAVRDASLTIDHRGFCELSADNEKVIELRASRLPDGGRVWLCSDVTERRRLTDRLQRIDRIEALGKMAGDSAHDFGNILSTINTHAHLLDTQQDKKATATLMAIKNAVEYGSALTQRLLAFAKKQNLTPEVIDLNALVDGMVDLVEISLKPDIEFNVDYSDAPIWVLVDPGLLESSLLNLVINANQAIEGAGTITLALNVESDRTAHITISDTGAGMTPVVLSRVVEPFFTTRSGDGGTGLGLSIAYGFFRQTGGDLNITSEKGSGTKIDVMLPLANENLKSTPDYMGKIVLLVEDEDAARIHAKRLLAGFGFQIHEASNGQSALDKITQGEFDLLVTDLDLGTDPNGWAVVDQFLARPSHQHAIVVSGRLAEAPAKGCHTSKTIQCLDKPLNFERLNVALQELFSGPKIEK